MEDVREPSPPFPPNHTQHTQHHPPMTALPTTTVNETRQWPTYGSVTTMSVSSQANRAKPVTTKRYRLPFIILLAFDWGLVVFFSVVVMQVCRCVCES